MKKNPILGGLLNMLIPGLAFAYIGRWGRAVVQFISAVIGLVALGALIALVESTNPPWPEEAARAVFLVLFYVGLFLAGVSVVGRHNRSSVPSGLPAQSSGNRALVLILVGIIVILCGLLVAVVAMSGILDTDEERTEVAASLPPPTSTLLARGQAPEPTVEGAAESSEESKAQPTAAGETPADPRALVTNDTLNIRSGPGTSYPIVGGLKRGDEVTVTGRNKAGTWLAIITDEGAEGWVYADYTSVDRAVESLPVAQASPPPASPTPSGPKPTLSVDEQIAKVAGDDHGTLPQPGEVGGVDAGGQAEVTILNDTPYQLTVLIGSPNSIKVTVEACPSCKVYSMVGPVFCPEEGRPKQTIRLAPGSMKVVAKVNDASVTPFYGTWELRANTAYFNCFYIVRSMR